MLKEKLLRVSIILIALFTATIYFVTDNKVNNLVDKSVTAKMDNIVNMGLDIVRSRYVGEWSIKDGKLYLGDKLVSENFKVLDEIKEKTDSHASIYFADERVVTSELDKDGNRAVGTRVSTDVGLSVLGKGVAYEGTEDILGKKYAVKYVPIKDKDGKIIGMWSVAVLKESVGNQGAQILAMRASIVVISVLCGLIGCVILMLYAKKFLVDIDTLKVTFLGGNSNTNKTQQRVLKMSLFLICTFFVIWFTIQGYTIGNVVNNLEGSNIKDRLDASSRLGYMLVDDLYKGDWAVEGNKMYKGKNYLNDNSVILDRISFDKGYFSTIFMGDTSVSTNIIKADGTKPIGIKAANEIVETVLKQGKEYTGEVVFGDKTSVARYIPLKDINGKTIGMWGIGVEKKIAVNQIANIRKAITQISILAIIIAFSMFLYLSIKMVSDINNFKVSLHTNIN